MVDEALPYLQRFSSFSSLRVPRWCSWASIYFSPGGRGKTLGNHRENVGKGVEHVGKRYGKIVRKHGFPVEKTWGTIWNEHKEHEQHWKKHRVACNYTTGICTGWRLVEGDGCAHMMCHVCGAYPGTFGVKLSVAGYSAFQVTVLQYDKLFNNISYYNGLLNKLSDWWLIMAYYNIL